MDVINRAFHRGDVSGGLRRVALLPFLFRLTMSRKSFDWENPKNLPLFEMTAKYGTPYFQNFVNSELNPSDVRSMCCRITAWISVNSGNAVAGLFGSAEMTGSIGVVTINAARLGYYVPGGSGEVL
jgi:anaerobic ribonucleoside-triphosphate reductase